MWSRIVCDNSVVEQLYPQHVAEFPGAVAVPTCGPDVLSLRVEVEKRLCATVPNDKTTAREFCGSHHVEELLTRLTMPFPYFD